MKIGFVIPLRKSSAIGWNFGVTVGRALAQLADIEIWTPEPFDPIEGLPVVPFRAGAYPQDRLAARDLMVYHLGDNSEFHGDIFALSRVRPGIVVAHDMLMHNFFRGFALHHPAGGGVTEYGAALEAAYGERGRAVFERHLRGASLQDLETMADVPLFEPVIAGARGVVVHSAFMLDRVRAVFAGPATRMFLAYPAAPLPVPSKTALGVPPEATLVTSIGYLNRNRNLTTVLEVLGSDPGLAAKVRYHLVGPATDDVYLARIEELLDRFRLRGIVKLLGYADTQTLRAYLASTDVFVNVRYPALEGASASIVEQMLAGKATIVGDTGFYAELPDDVVRKVPVPANAESIGAALHELVDDADRRTRMGERAQAFAAPLTTGEAWATSFLPFATEVLRGEPVAAIIDTLAQRLTLLGIDPTSNLVGTLIDESRFLFGEKP